MIILMYIHRNNFIKLPTTVAYYANNISSVILFNKAMCASKSCKERDIGILCICLLYIYLL